MRTDTAIGENPVSVAYAAVDLARQIFSDMERSTALLLGAGETIELWPGICGTRVSQADHCQPDTRAR